MSLLHQFLQTFLDGRKIESKVLKFPLRNILTKFYHGWVIAGGLLMQHMHRLD
ncbi:hypothetical protein SH139x_004600 [Planctomycetaceae bacterium SH139]